MVAPSFLPSSVRSQLRDMKCSIDNKAPRRSTHLRTKAKKNALMEDRITQIETENRILLEKMTHIMHSKGGIDNKNDSSSKYSRSLNIDRRKRELARITKDNYQILRRIEGARPAYNHKAWKKQAEKNDKVLQNICQYPPILNKGKGTWDAGANHGSSSSRRDDRLLEEWLNNDMQYL